MLKPPDSSGSAISLDRKAVTAYSPDLSRCELALLADFSRYELACLDKGLNSLVSLLRIDGNCSSGRVSESALMDYLSTVTCESNYSLSLLATLASMGVCGTTDFFFVMSSVRVIVSSLGCIGLMENWLESRAESLPSKPLDLFAAEISMGVSVFIVGLVPSFGVVFGVVA